MSVAPLLEVVAALRGVDATYIADGLFQGSAPPEGRAVREAGFDLLVLCAQSYQPAASKFPGVQVIHCPFQDAPITAEAWRDARRVAQEVADALRAGKRRCALVTCVAGRNRSGLVVALVLHYLYSLSGWEAAGLVQNCRTQALTNKTFVVALAGI